MHGEQFPLRRQAKRASIRAAEFQRRNSRSDRSRSIALREARRVLRSAERHPGRESSQRRKWLRNLRSGRHPDQDDSDPSKNFAAQHARARQTLFPGKRATRRRTVRKNHSTIQLRLRLYCRAVSGCGQSAAIAVACRRSGSIFEDLKSKAFVKFHTRGTQQRANCFGGAPLASNHFAQIFGMNS